MSKKNKTTKTTKTAKGTKAKVTTIDAGGGIGVDIMPPAAEVTVAKGPTEKKAKKTSGLDAAAQILQEKGEPMTCGALVEAMIGQGLWKTSGKTPAATIYSAILREIDHKPGEARFAKTGRGLFTFVPPKKG